MIVDDYRCTKYCERFTDITLKKDELEKNIQMEHKKMITDYHKYVRRNDSFYKKEFIKIYNGKCAYCGISIDVIGKEVFEIDHFRNKKREDFFTEGEAGYMGNLVLSCHDCNNCKNSFAITDSNEYDLNPDKEEIYKNFIRDDMFYIQVSKRGTLKSDVTKFYKKLHFDSEMRRIDYLLMSMMGLENKIKKRGKEIEGLSNAILLILKKRNLMSV